MPDPTGFAFTDSEIDPRALEARVRRDCDGAIVTFLGVTRSETTAGRGRVVSLAYEAYERMARAKAARIVAEARARYELGGVGVVHRLGEVPVGACSIAVVVSAPHRQPAFAAAQEIMDRIKKELPIFKKETLAGGGGGWVGELPDV